MIELTLTSTYQWWRHLLKREHVLIVELTEGVEQTNDDGGVNEKGSQNQLSAAWAARFLLEMCQLTVVINVSGLSVDTPAYIGYFRSTAWSISQHRNADQIISLSENPAALGIEPRTSKRYIITVIQCMQYHKKPNFPIISRHKMRHMYCGGAVWVF